MLRVKGLVAEGMALEVLPVAGLAALVAGALPAEGIPAGALPVGGVPAAGELEEVAERESLIQAPRFPRRLLVSVHSDLLGRRRGPNGRRIPPVGRGIARECRRKCRGFPNGAR